jgi:uncharacterized SAM-binding protein YcdF (DUF218 family)
MKKSNVKTIIPIMILGLLFLLFGRTFGVLFIIGNVIMIFLIKFLLNKYREVPNTTYKAAARGLIVIYGLFLLSFITVEGYILYESGRSKSFNAEEVDAIIILGAGLKGETPSKTLLSRLEAGRVVLDENKELPVVVSGGQGEGETIPEAEAMGRYLMGKGIPENRILYERTSTTTYENLRNSRDVLRKQGMEDPHVLIVTSDYHVVRAKLIAEDLGIEADGLSGDSPLIVRVNYFIREYFALGKMLMEKVLSI